MTSRTMEDVKLKHHHNYRMASLDALMQACPFWKRPPNLRLSEFDEVQDSLVRALKDLLNVPEPPYTVIANWDWANHDQIMLMLKHRADTLPYQDSSYAPVAQPSLEAVVDQLMEDEDERAGAW
jgi:hypothetical protein